jgi:hypothetical protein
MAPPPAAIKQACLALGLQLSGCRFRSAPYVNHIVASITFIALVATKSAQQAYKEESL